MLLSETVTQKVGRKKKRVGISSEEGRVINNGKVVYGKNTSRGRREQKNRGRKNGSIKEQEAKAQLGKK